MSALFPSPTDAIAPAPPAALTLMRAYISLTKPRIMSLLLTTTLAAFLIAAREYALPLATFLRLLVATLIGGALASGGAAALNCYIDRDIDAVMARTRRRPLPTGAVRPRDVLVYGLLLTLAAVVLLALLTNPLAALLALLGNVYYVVIYTLWLKRSTRQNIVIGGVAGAIPPLVGWSAVTGGLALPALLLFLIIVLWTPVHFWSLALLTSKDYSAVGVPMLPVVAGERDTKRQIVVYALAVVATTLVLYLAHAMGAIYLAAALVLGAGLVGRAISLLRDSGVARARGTFIYTNLYLAFLFCAMVVDRIVPVGALH